MLKEIPEFETVNKKQSLSILYTEVVGATSNEGCLAVKVHSTKTSIMFLITVYSLQLGLCSGRNQGSRIRIIRMILFESYARILTYGILSPYVHIFGRKKFVPET